MIKKKIIKKIRIKMKKIRDKYLTKLKNEKTGLITILRHNVKTPLVAQINSLELIFKKDCSNLTEFQIELLKENLSSNYFLLNLIENTLFLIEFEENKKEYKNYENLDFSSEIINCCTKVNCFAHEKQQKIIFNNNQNIKLKTDKKMFDKLIENILNTSILSGNENSKIEINLKENENKISFSAKNSSLFMSEEKIKDLAFNKNTNDFSQLGMKLNYNVIEKLARINNWKFRINSDENTCLFNLEIDK